MKKLVFFTYWFKLMVLAATVSITSAWRQRSDSDSRFLQNGRISLLQSSFDKNDDGFVYMDDPWGYGQVLGSQFAKGKYTATKGSAGSGGLHLILGGRSTLDVESGMSGGFVKPFAVSTTSDVTVTFSYYVEFPPTYEYDEYSEVLCMVDGDFVGAGGNDFVDYTDTTIGDIPWTRVTLHVGLLSSGSYALTIGGHNNKKTHIDERTDIYFDDVSVTAQTLPSIEPAPLASSFPTDAPLSEPTSSPTSSPTDTRTPTSSPSSIPTDSPTTSLPPTFEPTQVPSSSPIHIPTNSTPPTLRPTGHPSSFPTDTPSSSPIADTNPPPTTAPIPVAPLITITDADFNDPGSSAVHGFEFKKDMFVDGDDQYTWGFFVFTSGRPDEATGAQTGGMFLQLGGVDAVPSFNMSAGFRYEFTLDTRRKIQVEFDYQVVWSFLYDPGDNTRIMCGIDSDVIIDVDFFEASTPRGTTEWREAVVEIGVFDAGMHYLDLGGINNRKDHQKERTLIYFDNVRLTGVLV